MQSRIWIETFDRPGGVRLGFVWKDEFDQFLCADWPLMNNANIKRVLTGCFLLPIPLFGAKIKKISELPDHLDLR